MASFTYPPRGSYPATLTRSAEKSTSAESETGVDAVVEMLLDVSNFGRETLFDVRNLCREAFLDVVGIGSKA